uniref:Uncharacterized protein n=1 Tax=Rousettus aegyptiacus TaxID=9407 RepID=A0A7J8DXH1_ROUAE|nr:hypothetical protein HJG63_008380 [Rousettus aegyptiacus]
MVHRNFYFQQTFKQFQWEARFGKHWIRLSPSLLLDLAFCASTQKVLILILQKETGTWKKMGNGFLSSSNTGDGPILLPAHFWPVSGILKLHRTARVMRGASGMLLTVHRAGVLWGLNRDQD